MRDGIEMLASKMAFVGISQADILFALVTVRLMPSAGKRPGPGYILLGIDFPCLNSY